MAAAEMIQLISAALCYAAFVFICMLLIVKRYSRKESLLILACFLVSAVAFSAVLIVREQGINLALTMLPLTAYLPAIICVHILSASGFIQTTAVWSVGLLQFFSMKFIRKLIILQINTFLGQNFVLFAAVEIMSILVISALFIFAADHYLRKPFQKYVLNAKGSWAMVGMPVMAIFIMFSYFFNSVTSPIVFVLLFIVTASIFFLITKVLVSVDAAVQLKESKHILEKQMEIQYNDYEDVRKKFEMGRIYRHDMRHHLTALDSILQQDGSAEAMEYIQKLNRHFGDIEKENYCENTEVNAVLAAYIGHARELGCKVKTKIQIPKDVPFEEPDLCVILSNALENAINACMKAENCDDRNIQVEMSFVNNRRLTISVENQCLEEIDFDEEGFPKKEAMEGHGIGLRSIEAIAKKYNGIFSCGLKEQVFSTRAVLFAPVPLQGHAKVQKKKLAQNLSVILLTFVLFANLSPSVSEALSSVPVAGEILHAVTFDAFLFRWGDSQMNIDMPIIEMSKFDQSLSAKRGRKNDDLGKTEGESGKVITMDGEKGGSAAVPKLPASKDPQLKQGIDEVNGNMEAYVEKLKEKFIWYVARKHNGYVALDSSYQVICNNQDMISIRFDTTINAGGSGQYFRCFTLDKQTGESLDLQGLFKKKSDYVSILSAEILKQMRSQMNAGKGDYFLPGGTWPEEDCFKAIDADQNFYINKKGKLTIVFDEYIVAPGSMGTPEFVIPTGTIKKILKKTQLIK